MEEIDEHSNFRKTKLKPKLIMVLSQVTEAPTMKEARKTRNPYLKNKRPSKIKRTKHPLSRESKVPNDTW